MSHVFSCLDAEFAQTQSTAQYDQERCGKVRQILAMMRVPMLDWPSDLFSDSASIAELMDEDFAESWTPSAHGSEMLVAA